MKIVAVTGASGFIGKNLCAELELNDIRVERFDRQRPLAGLSEVISEVDFIFHLAGVNRPESTTEFKSGNQGLTEELLEIVNKSGRKIPILFTSSTQAILDNPYGKSKLSAEKSLQTWSSQYAIPVYIFRLTNVFGKWCRPNYNSVVATFCNNLATNKALQINDPTTKLSLVYVSDVVQAFIDTFRGHLSPAEDGFFYAKPTVDITLQELVDKLHRFDAMRKTLIVPDLEPQFERNLYATFTSYFREDDFSYELEMKRDDRGWLSEIIKSENFGQIFVSKTKPGIPRGNHWHHTKIEKFLVVEGNAEIQFRNYNTDKIITYSVSGDKLEIVDIPAGYIHSITNTGTTDLLTIFWADEMFNPDKPDTYYEEVKQ